MVNHLTLDQIYYVLGNLDGMICNTLQLANCREKRQSAWHMVRSLLHLMDQQRYDLPVQMVHDVVHLDNLPGQASVLHDKCFEALLNHLDRHFKHLGQLDWWGNGW